MKRKFDQWEFPGGKLDGTERIEECVIRELAEETGIIAEKVKFITNVGDDKYCCLMFMVTEWKGVASLLEADKQPIMRWLPFYDLPKRLTRAAKASIEAGVLEPLYAEAGITRGTKER